MSLKLIWWPENSYIKRLGQVRNSGNLLGVVVERTHMSERYFPAIHGTGPWDGQPDGSILLPHQPMSSRANQRALEKSFLRKKGTLFSEPLILCFYFCFETESHFVIQAGVQ